MAPPPSSSKKRQKGKQRGDNDDDYGYSGRNQKLQKPPDQEKLTDAELKEEFIRTLDSTDSQKAKNLCVWDYNEKTFTSFIDPDSCVYLFVMDSELYANFGEEIKEVKGELIDEISDKEEDEHHAKHPSTGPIVPHSKLHEKKLHEDKGHEEKAHDAKSDQEEKAHEAKSQHEEKAHEVKSQHLEKAHETKSHTKVKPHESQSQHKAKAQESKSQPKVKASESKSQHKVKAHETTSQHKGKGHAGTSHHEEHGEKPHHDEHAHEAKLHHDEHGEKHHDEHGEKHHEEKAHHHEEDHGDKHHEAKLHHEEKGHEASLHHEEHHGEKAHESKSHHGEKLHEEHHGEKAHGSKSHHGEKAHHGEKTHETNLHHEDNLHHDEKTHEAASHHEGKVHEAKSDHEEGKVHGVKSSLADASHHEEETHETRSHHEGKVHEAHSHHEDRHGQHEGKHHEDDDGEEEKLEPVPSKSSKPMKLLNQFNCIMRATQTANNKNRDHNTQTELPPRASRNNMCNLFIIYDAYVADSANQDAAAKGAGDQKPPAPTTEGHEHADKHREIIKEKPKLVEKEKVKVRKASIIEGQAATDVAYTRAAETLQYLERFIATNVNDEIMFDFKYFEDSSDDYRENGEGTLLPLWRFMYDKSKKKHVTCISWSQSQPDIFAVSFGSFSFIHPVQAGYVVIFSLRNPNYPEHVWMSPKGAMAVHIHPARESLVCVGLIDGNVAVLNLEKNEENASQTEVLRNNPMVFKHYCCPVWSVKWGLDDIDGNPTFYSAGMDGKVNRWTIGVPDINGFYGLEGQEVSTMTIPNAVVSGPDGTSYNMFGCARCVAFHPTEKNNFLVGTSEGKIFCSSALFGDKFLQIYDAHYLAVAALQWNPYHFEVFISCSEDWTIKIWDRNDQTPVFVFEIGVPILDVCWAPYSSTVFGAVTSEGKALIFDLLASRDKPACTQQVVTKKKVHPHRISFNPIYPIVVVGDDRGSLITLKLSPNLRLLAKDDQGQLLEGDDKIEFEINKMKRMLRLVRDPPIITDPKEEEVPIVTNLAEIPGALSEIP